MDKNKRKELEEDLRTLARDIIESEGRATFITIPEAWRRFGDEYPETDRERFAQAIGIILAREDFAESWSGKSYRIKPEKL